MVSLDPNEINGDLSDKIFTQKILEKISSGESKINKFDLKNMFSGDDDTIQFIDVMKKKNDNKVKKKIEEFVHKVGYALGQIKDIVSNIFNDS